MKALRMMVSKRYSPKLSNPDTNFEEPHRQLEPLAGLVENGSQRCIRDACTRHHPLKGEQGVDQDIYH